jgi:hypothetical protein
LIDDPDLERPGEIVDFALMTPFERAMHCVCQFFVAILIVGVAATYLFIAVHHLARAFHALFPG